MREDDLLYACIHSLLEALAAVEAQIAALDKRLAALVRRSKPCWHLTSVPGVGPITALAFAAAIEEPGRFRRSRDVGAYLGLTPRRYQSGERDVGGGISRQGDAMARHYLYEAANCLLTTWGGRSALKRWGLGLMRRIGAKKARVAFTGKSIHRIDFHSGSPRKLARLLLRLWKAGDHYQDEPRRVCRRLQPLRGWSDDKEDLDDWVRSYNEQREHQGRWCFGKTPMRTFLDAVPIAKEKMIAA